MRVDLLRQTALFAVALGFAACGNPVRSGDANDLATAPADLVGAAPADLALSTGEADLAIAKDLGSATDLAVAHDLAAPVDLATEHDLAVPPDLAPLADLTAAPPDLTPPIDLAGPVDMTPPVYSASNPIQVDLSSILNVDTIGSSAVQTYPPLASMDGSGYDFLTETVAESNFDDGAGLPADGYFASDGDHPNAQLAFNDSSTTPNSVILNAPPTPVLSVSFPMIAAPLSALQLYFTSTEGASSVSVTLHYGDGTSDVTSFTVPDWFQWGNATAPVFVVQEGLSRFSMQGDDFSEGAALYGAGVVVNAAKTLTSVTVATTSTGGRLVIYGATAY